eukprot:EG_transcript_12006
MAGQTAAAMDFIDRNLCVEGKQQKQVATMLQQVLEEANRLERDVASLQNTIATGCPETHFATCQMLLKQSEALMTRHAALRDSLDRDSYLQETSTALGHRLSTLSSSLADLKRSVAKGKGRLQAPPSAAAAAASGSPAPAAAAEFQQLSAMLPHLPPDVIRAALRDFQGDVGRAADFLVEAFAGGRPPPRPVELPPASAVAGEVVFFEPGRLDEYKPATADFEEKADGSIVLEMAGPRLHLRAVHGSNSQTMAYHCLSGARVRSSTWADKAFVYEVPAQGGAPTLMHVRFRSDHAAATFWDISQQSVQLSAAACPPNHLGHD